MQWSKERTEGVDNKIQRGEEMQEMMPKNDNNKQSATSHYTGKEATTTISNKGQRNKLPSDMLEQQPHRKNTKPGLINNVENTHGPHSKAPSHGNGQGTA